MLITGCGSLCMGCCGGMGLAGTGLGAVCGAAPCSTGMGRFMAVRRVILVVAPHVAHCDTHVSWDRKQFSADPGLPVFEL